MRAKQLPAIIGANVAESLHMPGKVAMHDARMRSDSSTKVIKAFSVDVIHADM